MDSLRFIPIVNSFHAVFYTLFAVDIEIAYDQSNNHVLINLFFFLFSVSIRLNSIQVYVGQLSLHYEALSVEASKQTTAEEIVACIVERLSLTVNIHIKFSENNKSFQFLLQKTMTTTLIQMITQCGISRRRKRQKHQF